MKKLLSLILAFMVLFVSVPNDAFELASAEDEYALYVGGVGMKKGDYLPVGATKTQSESPENGGYAHYNGLYLALVDYTYEGDGYLIKQTSGSQTKTYPMLVYSKKDLTVQLYGYSSLVGTQNYNISYAIYSEGSLSLSGDEFENLYLRAKYPLRAMGDVTINNSIIDIYSEYYYGIASDEGRIALNNSSARIRGEHGIVTLTEGKDVELYNSHVDIKVEHQGIYSGGGIYLNDTYLKAVATSTATDSNIKNFAIYSGTQTIRYFNTNSRASTDPYGNSPVMFKTENALSYHFVEIFRPKVLKYIDVTGILPPETQCFPDGDGNAESPYTKIFGIEWFAVDENGKVLYRLGQKYSFVEGKKYRLRVKVIADESYEFDDINTSAYIGNDSVNYYSYGLNNKILILEKDYVAAYNPANYKINIGNVTLKDGDYLVKGASTVTTEEPADNYAYYKNGALYLNNFVDKDAEIEFFEGYLDICVNGDSTIASIRDSFETDGEVHHVSIATDGELEIIGSNSNVSSPCGVNLSGELLILWGTVNVSADYLYCLDVDTLCVYGGEIYCYSSQAGVFASGTTVNVYRGVFHAFDGGGWNKFINEDVVIRVGTVYVSNDGKNSFETATLWDGETPLTGYDAVWVVPDEIDDDPDTSEPETSVPEEPDMSEPDMSEPEPDYLLGDVNNDGSVDSTDYLRIKSHFLSLLTLEGKAFKAGDVDFSGTIDSTDYLRIKGHFLGVYNIHE